MNEQVKNHIDQYPGEIIAMYHTLRQLVFDSVSARPEETLWAKLPSYYVGHSFVRLIPFKDHINIEAQAILQHKEELAAYKTTPKGMLQIYGKQDVPCDVLKKIFAETLRQQTSGTSVRHESASRSPSTHYIPQNMTKAKL